MNPKTNPTQDIKISLSAKALIELIESLKKNGAKEFKYGSLHIRFADIQEETYNSTNQSANLESFERRAEELPKDEGERMSDLMLADPSGYEEALHAQLDGSADDLSNTG